MVQAKDELLTVKEAAALLKVTPHTVYRWVHEGRLPAVRYSPRVLRLRRSDLGEAGANDVATPLGPGRSGRIVTNVDPDDFEGALRLAHQRAAARPKVGKRGTVGALRHAAGIISDESGDELWRVIKEAREADRKLALATSDESHFD